MAYKVLRSSGDYRLYLTLTRGTANVAGNYTPVTVRLYLKKNSGTNYSPGLSATDSRTWSWSGSGITNRSGSYVFNFRGKENYGEILLRSETFNVAHNSDGSRGNLTVSATVNFAHTYLPSSVSISESVSFTTIPRASTFSLGGSTKTNNDISVSISRKSSSFNHRVRWRIGTGTWTTVQAYTWTGTSTNFKVQPSAFGANSTSATITVRVQTYSGSTAIGSEATVTRTLTIDTSTVSISGTASTGSTQTASVNARGGSGLTHSYSWKLGSSSAGNYSTWIPPHSALPSSTSGTLTCTLTTKRGTSTVGTHSATRTISVPTSIVPTVSSLTHSENVSSVSNLGLGSGIYVQHRSRIKLSMSGSAGSGASIKSYRITVAGQTANASSGVTNIITQSGTQTITATITDSRNRTASRTATITVRPYSTPRLTLVNIDRSNSSGIVDPLGAYARIQTQATATSLRNSSGTEKNKIKLVIHTRTSGSGSWTNGTTYDDGGLTLNKTKVFSNMLKTQDYDVRFQISDALGEVTTLTGGTYYIPTAGANFFVGSRGTASSFGKLPTHGSTYDLEIGDKGVRVDGPIIGKDGREIESIGRTELADFIVERDSGLSVTGGYEKWNSGILRVWARGTIASLASGATGSVDIVSPVKLTAGGNVQATIRTANNVDDLTVTRGLINSTMGGMGGANVRIKNNSSATRTGIEVQVVLLSKWK